MFRLTRLPLRRCLHTAAGPVKATSYRRGFAVGLSAAALAFAIPTIALDSPLASTSSPVVLEKPHENAQAETPPATEPSSEGASGGAYNPETGEINWDCPCLGGMADGPCGEEFKAAFSCFVHSNDEPKGINCVEKFQGMQNCFREHPEVYASELMDDDEEDSAQNPSQTDEPVAAASTTTSDDASHKPKPKRKATTSPAPSS